MRCIRVCQAVEALHALPRDARHTATSGALHRLCFALLRSSLWQPLLLKSTCRDARTYRRCSQLAVSQWLRMAVLAGMSISYHTYMDLLQCFVTLHSNPSGVECKCCAIIAYDTAARFQAGCKSSSSTLTENMQRHPTPACKAAHACKCVLGGIHLDSCWRIRHASWAR
jgi:hypothetical protein